MAEEAAAPEETQDTPTPEAPEGASDEAPEGYVSQERYESLRSNSDRRYNEALEQLQQHEEFQQALHTNPEFRDQFVRDQGWYEFEDGEEADPEDEPPKDPRVDQLMAEREEQRSVQEQEELEELQYGYIDQSIEQIERQVGREFTQEEAEEIGNLALAFPNEQGIADVPGAYKRFQRREQAAIKQYVESKRQAATAPLGRQGSRKVDLTNDEQRIRAMAEAIEAGQDTER